MSMNSYLGFGYMMATTEANSLLKHGMKAKEFKEYKQLLDEGSYEEALSFANPIFKKNSFAEASQIMIFSMEDDIDETLKHDVPYFYFDESDLFITRPKKEMKNMKEFFNQPPTMRTFSLWG